MHPSTLLNILYHHSNKWQWYELIKFDDNGEMGNMQAIECIVICHRNRSFDKRWNDGHEYFSSRISYNILKLSSSSNILVDRSLLVHQLCICTPIVASYLAILSLVLVFQSLHGDLYCLLFILCRISDPFDTWQTVNVNKWLAHKLPYLLVCLTPRRDYHPLAVTDIA